QERGNGGYDKRNHSQAKRMRKRRPVTIFAMRECAQKLGDPAAKIDGQAQDRAQLNNDCVHLPVSVTQIDVKQGFGNAQVRGRTDRQEFRQTLDNAKNRRKKVVVQYSSRTTRPLRSPPALTQALLFALPKFLTLESLHHAWSKAVRFVPGRPEWSRL